jgi:hypothetical protein
MSFASRRQWVGFLLLPLLTLSGECHASPPCAATISDLRILLADQSFPLKWHETTMAEQLRIATTGWSGTFSSRQRK